ncbi:MAG: hypothetical protein JJ979_02380 [Roseibium sp.]|nr:hypothetical protein [Roseibium sp.]
MMDAYRNQKLAGLDMPSSDEFAINTAVAQLDGPAGPLSVIRSKISLLQGKTAEIVGVTAQSADRLLGPEPQAAEGKMTSSGIAAPTGEISEILTALSELEFLIDQAMHNSTRILSL